MPEIKIPIEHHSKIETLTTLSKEMKDSLVEKIKASPMGLTPNTFADYLATELPLEKEKITDILQVAFSLLNAKDKLRLNQEGLNASLKKALEGTEIAKKTPIEAIVSDLEKLLSANGDNAFATAKIIDLMTENSNVFFHSKA